MIIYIWVYALNKPIYNDSYHQITRLRHRRYRSEIHEIMNELGVTWQKARRIRLERKRKAACENFERELEVAQESS